MNDRTVLLVDDNQSLLSALNEMLSGAGHVVVCCRCFEEARHYLQAHTPDAIVTGIRLGSYNGLHLVLLASAGGSKPAAIVYSSDEGAGIRQEAASCGAAYVDRNALAEDLLPVLTACLAACENPASAARQLT